MILLDRILLNSSTTQVIYDRVLNVTYNYFLHKRMEFEKSLKALLKEMKFLH